MKNTAFVFMHVCVSICRERNENAKCVVGMAGQETWTTSPSGTVHRFTYDHSFWSVSESDPDFASQEEVYSKLAMPLLDWSFDGYNTCLFAYGQVGAPPRCSVTGFEYRSLFCRSCAARLVQTTTDCRLCDWV